jgi:hypothetical protein
LLANALLKNRTPRHQAKAQAVIQHCKASARRDNHPPIDAGGALTVDQRSIRHARLGRECFSDTVEFVLTQRRKQIRWHLQAVAIAQRESLFDQEIYAFT